MFGGCIMVSGVLAGGVAGVTANAFASGIVAGMSYALYTIFSQYAVERGYSSMTTTFYTFAFALISCVLLVDFGQITGAVKTGGVVGMYLVVSAIILFNLKVKPKPVTISSELAIKDEPAGEILT
ncbi:membrane hypothetical protein [uncultured Sporomusa sp.]|uniref:Uncharacterized protein n=2 Tax=uncultured Sporomusa sp. TaxID=307249 RepID=A0A212LLQ8_9FIRM|nr:membrane hypothetical protein [uncultured Sporomusa sp.]